MSEGQNGKGSKRRPGKSGAYEEGWDRVFRKPKWPRFLKDGEPCDHPGCANHVTHPCEKCGRVAARGVYDPDAWETLSFFQQKIHETDENR